MSLHHPALLVSRPHHSGACRVSGQLPQPRCREDRSKEGIIELDACNQQREMPMGLESSIRNGENRACEDVDVTRNGNGAW